ncbi:type VII secretion-associated serine protease mycosin [Streptomyces sp. NPDC000658]|uniref:type VII secretion-associated serine protease mycosin n=1 Tax=Streptomyces sp. NPDC000658 TaxID=3154266 RepID=UPI003323CFEE
MHTSSKQTLRAVSLLSATLGMLLMGTGASPAHAESVRNRQWHLDAMHAEDMWKISTGQGITVAVIDTGVDDTLADLKGQVLSGKDLTNQTGDEHTDPDGHGTGIAALIAATGRRGGLDGSFGLAPGSRILPIRLAAGAKDFSEFTSGSTYAAALTTAIRFAADSEARIINVSGGSFDQGADTAALRSAVTYALGKGKLIFAAAGNEGDKANQPGYPASTPGVVAVGAINDKVRRSAFSEHGPEIDVTAPGENMYHACPGGTQVCKSSGTSDATAIASASAALIWSKHPTWTNNQVLRVLINTMKGNEKGWTRNDDFGYGIVRPRVALETPGDPGPAGEYPLPDLAAASASASPSGKASPSTGSAPGDGKADGTPAAAASDSGDDGDAALWIALGAGAAALLGAAVAVPAIRSRRRRTAQPAAAAPVPPGYAPGPQQPYPSYGQPQGPLAGPPSEGTSGPGGPSAH